MKKVRDMEKRVAELEEIVTLLVSLGFEHEDRLGSSDDVLRHHRLSVA